MTGREDQERPADDGVRDVAFDALVRTDPAGASVPDPTRLWPLVVARTQEDAAGEYGSAASGAPVTPLVDTTSGLPEDGGGVVVSLGMRRRRRVARFAAAAAAAAVAVSGGYALGVRQAPEAPDVVASSTETYGAEVAGDPTEDAAVQRLVFTAADLPAGPADASVWVLDPSVDPSAPASGGSDEDALADDLFEHDGTLSRGRLVGELPLVPVEEAVARLGDPVYAVSRLPGAPLEEPTVDPSDVPGGVVPWSVVEVEITGVNVTSEIVPGGDGRQWVVPVYAFDDGRDNVWRVLALSDEAIDRVR